MLLIINKFQFYQVVINVLCSQYGMRRLDAIKQVFNNFTEIQTHDSIEDTACRLYEQMYISEYKKLQVQRQEWETRNLHPRSLDDIKKEADECINRLLYERKTSSI